MSYSITAGNTGSVFAIGSSTGAITYTGSGENHETTPRFTLTVRASDGTAHADVTVTVTVTDVNELPGVPAAPTFGTTTATSVVVNWLEPRNPGPAITDYDVRYRAGTSGAWTTHPHAGTGRTATLTGLTLVQRYRVQVRATSPEGTSAWSPAGTANRPPAFAAGATATRSFPENTAAGQDFGAALTATDPDGDSLTWSLGGTDAASFDIAADSGQLRTKADVAYDFETKASYAVTVKVSDGGKTDSIAVTITLTDVDGEAPSAPAAPTFGRTTETTVVVNWTEPANTGPDITDYDVRYREGASGGWTNHAHERHGDDGDAHRPDRGPELPGAGAGAERRGHGRLVGLRHGDARARHHGAVAGLGDDRRTDADAHLQRGARHPLGAVGDRIHRAVEPFQPQRVLGVGERPHGGPDHGHGGRRHRHGVAGLRPVADEHADPGPLGPRRRRAEQPVRWPTPRRGCCCRRPR